MEKVNNDLSPIGRTPDLESELDKLQAILDSLILVYNAKKDATENSISTNNAGEKHISSLGCVRHLIGGKQI